MDVACVLPALAEGSGGHRTILSNLTAVAERGVDVTMVLEESDHPLASQLAIADSLVAGSSTRFRWLCGWDTTVSSDIGLATSARSAEPLRENVSAGQFAYFVQDWESWFNPMGDGYLSAELSYLQDWRFITIGDWLRHRLLAIDPTRRVGSVHFGSEVSLSRLASPRFSNTAPVVLNYQPDKSRRLAQLTLKVAETLSRQRPDIPVLLFGSETELPEDSTVLSVGMLSEAQMLDLFTEAACVVHFSSSNPSRIPFEAVACGTPTVEFFGESTCFDFPRRGVHTVIPVVPEIVDGITTVYDDPDRFLTDAVQGMRELRSRTDEMSSFADLLLDPDLSQPAPSPNRTNPDLHFGLDKSLNDRYVSEVRQRIGAER